MAWPSWGVRRRTPLGPGGFRSLWLSEDLVWRDVDAVSGQGMAFGVEDTLVEGVALAVVAAVTHRPADVVR